MLKDLLKLQEAIKVFNIGSTTTEKDIRKIDFNGNLNINYEDNVNLLTIIIDFITNYYKFKKEYDNIQKLEGYEDIYFDNFYKENKRRVLSLTFFDKQKTMKSRNGVLLLTLEEDNNKYSSYVMNDYFLENRDFKEVNIDSNIIKQYLDLFENHEKTFKAFNHFKSGVFGNGFNVFRIFLESDNILKPLKIIQISFGNSYMNKEDYISFKLDISDLKLIKFVDSKIIIDNNKLDNEKEIIRYILENTYLNKEYLPSLYKNDKNRYVENSEEDIKEKLKIIKKGIKLNK